MQGPIIASYGGGSFEGTGSSRNFAPNVDVRGSTIEVADAGGQLQLSFVNLAVGFAQCDPSRHKPAEQGCSVQHEPETSYSGKTNLEGKVRFQVKLRPRAFRQSSQRFLVRAHKETRMGGGPPTTHTYQYNGRASQVAVTELGSDGLGVPSEEEVQYSVAQGNYDATTLVNLVDTTLAFIFGTAQIGDTGCPSINGDAYSTKVCLQHKGDAVGAEGVGKWDCESFLVDPATGNFDLEIPIGSKLDVCVTLQDAAQDVSSRTGIEAEAAGSLQSSIKSLHVFHVTPGQPSDLQSYSTWVSDDNAGLVHARTFFWLWCTLLLTQSVSIHQPLGASV